MLQAMRNGANGIVAKLLLGLLVLSFGLWGVGDMLRSDGGSATVASVGGVKISQGQARQEIARRTDELRQSMGSAYNPELFRQLDIGMQVLNGMIDEVLLKKEAYAQGIVVSDDAVQHIIARNPVFQTDGRFDLRRFKTLLANNRVNEAKYYDDLATHTAATLLVGPLSAPPPYPAALIPLLGAYQAEQRTANLIVLTESNVKQVPAPTDKELADFYEISKNRYTLPEYRTVSYAVIDLATLAKNAAVAPEEVKAVYAERAAGFHKPETREVEQLLYDTEEKAKQAYGLLLEMKVAKGHELASAAEKIPPVNAGKLLIGTVEKTQLPKEAADTVFSLKESTPGQPIKTDFGWHIFLVQKIIPEHTSTLEEMRAPIEAELKRKAAEEAVTRTANQIEDALAGGTPFAKAAKQAGITVQSAGPFARDGMAQDGKKLAGLTASRFFLDTAFATDEKTESQAAPADDGSYFILRVESVTPERVKAMAEIKPEMTREWTAEKRRFLLAGMADKAASELKKGTKFFQIAQSLGVSARGAGPLRRDAAKLPGLPETALAGVGAAFLNDLFSRKLGETTMAHRLGDGSFALAEVTSVLPAGKEALKDTGAIETRLGQSYHNELYIQYMRYLREKYDVTVYPDHMPKASEQAE